jgi:hypothetical protein
MAARNAREVIVLRLDHRALFPRQSALRYPVFNEFVVHLQYTGILVFSVDGFRDHSSGGLLDEISHSTDVPLYIDKARDPFSFVIKISRKHSFRPVLAKQVKQVCSFCLKHASQI